MYVNLTQDATYLEGYWQITSLTIVDTSFDPSTSDPADVTFSGYLMLYSDGDYSFSCESKWDNIYGSEYNFSFSGDYTIDDNTVTLDDMTSFTIDSDNNITWDFEIVSGTNLQMTLSKGISMESANVVKEYYDPFPITIKDELLGTSRYYDVTSSASMQLYDDGRYKMTFTAVWNTQGRTLNYGGVNYYGTYYYDSDGKIVMTGSGTFIDYGALGILWHECQGMSTVIIEFRIVED